MASAPTSPLTSVPDGEDLTPSSTLDRLVSYSRAAGLAGLVRGDKSGDQVVLLLGLEQPVIQIEQDLRFRKNGKREPCSYGLGLTLG
eukprot:scaffold52021_cov19-Prasinocladus_malaysianus.AAC.1